MPLKINDKAPNFTLPSTSGGNFTLNINAIGRPMIIYFYPKDFTTICTAEACEFRDAFSFFRGLQIDVYGISKDNVETHLKFKKIHNLPFELLSDEGGEVAELYKANFPILNFSRRVTYLLDKDHTIAEVLENSFIATKHIKMMIEAIKKSSFAEERY